MALVTVSGNLKTLLGASAGSGTVEFLLTNIGTGRTPIVSGTNVIVPLVTSAVVAADGSFSINLQGNDTITPANTLYAVTFYASGGAVGPTLYSFTGTAVNLNTAVPVNSAPPIVYIGDQVANTIFSGPATGVAAAPTFRALVSADLPLGSALTFTGANTHSGTETFGNINNIRVIDGVKFAKTAVGINAAVADIVSGTAGTIFVPFTGDYSDVVITLGKKHRLIFDAGTYIVAGINLPDSTTDATGLSGLEGAGPNLTILQLAANKNVDVVTSPNFSSLTGTSSYFGIFGSRIANLTIDGNKANQTAAVISGSGTITTVARASGVVTVTFSNTPSPAFAVNMAVSLTATVTGNTSFSGRFIVQSVNVGAKQITFRQAMIGGNTLPDVGTVAATGTALGISGPMGLRIYGRGYIVENVDVQNSVSDGIWTESNGAQVDTGPTTNLETSIRNVRAMWNNGNGLTDQGPNDLQIASFKTFDNGLWGWENASSAHVQGANAYLNINGGIHVFGTSGGINGSDVVGSTATGWGILVENGAGQLTLSASTAAGGVPLELRSSGGAIFQGVIGNPNPGSNPCLYSNNGGNNIVNAFFIGCGTTTVQFTTPQAASNIHGTGDTTPTQVVLGTPGGNDLVSIRTGTKTYLQLPTLALSGAIVDNLVGRATTDTLMNKTLTTPVINGAVTGTLSLPTSAIGTGTPAASKYVDGGTGAWTTLPGGGVPVFAVNLTAQQANISATTLTTPGANGFYRFSCFVVETQAATTSSTLPACSVTFTDADSSTAQAISASVGNTANLVGQLGINPPVTASANAGFFAKSGVAIAYQTTAYASVGATVMQYAIHVRLEGPF